MGFKPQKLKNNFFILFFLIFLLFYFLREGIQNLFFSIFSPLQSFLWQRAQIVFPLFEGLLNIKEIVKENEKLRKENERLATENFNLKEKERENEFLRKALNVSLEKNYYQLHIVKPIAKNFLEDTIVINGGKNQGLKEGMVLITNEKVLVGKISKVLENFSFVQLISDKNFIVDVQLKDSEIFGLGKGEGNLKIKVVFLPPEAKIQEGDYFFTSSLSKNFPAGLIFGRVKKVEHMEEKEEKNVWLELPFKLSQLSFLFVVKSW